MTCRARRRGAVVLCVGAASAVLAAAGPDALLPFEGLAAAAASEATVSVAFAVDFGQGEPVVACVKVPNGTSGYGALGAFTAQEQEQSPVYNASGLLCSINGDPGSGCGQPVNGGYAYWSYWLGTSGTWQYASTGAFADVQNGDVEGWRFEAQGKANPSDPPPAASPDYAAICGAATTPSTEPTPPATATGPPGPPPTATVGAAAPPAPSSTVPGGPRPPASTTPPSTGASATPLPGSAGHAGPTTSTTRPGPPGPAQSLRATAAASRRDAGNGALPLAVGAGLVIALVGLALWRWRQRPRAP